MIIKYNNYIKESNANDSKAVDSYFLQTYEETKAWLDSVGIKNYTINDDLTVDVDDVIISDKNLTKIPVQFGEINGSFYCYNNYLTSLKGSPKTINNDFYCSYNNLTSLKGCPKIIKGEFYCNNPLEDITDLDSKILIKSIKDDRVWTEQISTEVYDDYFEHWITKDINIVSILKDKVSDKIKEKYKHLFNANNFDLI